MAAKRLYELKDEIATPSDVAYYIRETLDPTGMELEHNQLNAVIEAASGSLVWAVTACRFLVYFLIQRGPSDIGTRGRLVQWVLKSGRGLPALYQVILDTFARFTSPKHMLLGIRASMGIVEPLSLSLWYKFAPPIFHDNMSSVIDL